MPDGRGDIQAVGANAGAVPEHDETGWLRRLAGAAPWLIVLGVAVVVLLQTGTPVLDIGRYGVYWCLGVTLPGVLVVRATVGTRGSWSQDVALGAVTGLALELVCLALWSVLGLQQWLWLWPLLVLATFVAVPRLRRHWRVRTPRRLPWLWSWGVASAIGVAIVGVRQVAFAAPLPPAGGAYYPDLPWHLAIVHELTRSFPPQIPQVAGEILRYHWFSHAHLASAHLVSGVPESTVVLRLWIVPLLALTALVGAGLALELSRRWWSGPVAAWSLVVLGGTKLLPAGSAGGIIYPGSPSQVFVVPVVLGAAILIIRALRGNRLGAGWMVLALLLMLAAGAKPTAMPLVLAGTCLAGLSLMMPPRLLVQRRRQWLAALSVVGLVAAIFPLSFLAVAGSVGGSRISLFDFVEFSPLYHLMTGVGKHPATGPFLPEGVSDLSGRSMLILAILLLMPLAANLGHLAPCALLGSRRLRADPATWFMAGFVLAGWFVYLVLSHPDLSQAYFLGLANAMAAVFGAWALAAVIPPTVDGGRRVVAVLAGGTFIGFAVVTLCRAVTPSLSGKTSDLAAVAVTFAIPFAVLGLLVVVGLATWAVARRKVPGLRGWGVGLVLAALVLGGPAHGAFRSSARALVAFASNRPVPQRGDMVVTPDAAAALAWIERNTPHDAVVATNRHCVAGPSRPECLSYAFWVSGLGGRRTVLEGWGYLNADTKTGGPSPYPERLAANDTAFSHPGAAIIDQLRRRYGTTWLVADTSAGPVSPELSRFATERFRSGGVTIYELP